MIFRFIIIFIGVTYILGKLYDFFVEYGYKQNNNSNYQIERNKKYGDRKIDYSQSLFDRNFDIIEYFSEKLNPNSNSYKPYFIENLTRDCINEICLAENSLSIQPGYKYLIDWKKNASTNWIDLSTQIEIYFKEKLEQNKNKQIEEERKKNEKRLQKEKEKEKQELNYKKNKEIQEIAIIDRTLNRLKRENILPVLQNTSYLKKTTGQILLNDIKNILKINNIAWVDKESILMNEKIVIKKYPLFDYQYSVYEGEIINNKIKEYNENIDSKISEHKQNCKMFKEIYNGFNNSLKEFVIKRVNYVFSDIELPEPFPKMWKIEFDQEESILILEFQLPDIVHAEIFKELELKSKLGIKTVEKLLNQKEFKEFAPKIQPAIMLRVAYEIFRNDPNEVIKLLVLNGWIEYDNPATGNKIKTYVSSLVVKGEQIINLNLSKVDPIIAFQNLKGKSSGSLIDIVPVTPTLSLNKNDKRIIDTKEVLNNLGSETNLASMDWQDFENLIAELFQKEFAEKGAEVKVTQSSRDRGVDAIVFDPDPIKGGKFVIQAKRYTRTVDVSAVRDLCAVVKKEGASRGILVTTSSYGSDAYAFAQNEPVTLLNGGELLGLLEKHGYKFRINISEARKILKDISN